MKVDLGCVSEVSTMVAEKVSKKGDIALTTGPGIPLACKCVVCKGCNLCIGVETKTKVLKILVPKVGKVSKDVTNQIMVFSGASSLVAECCFHKVRAGGLKFLVFIS